MFIERFWGVEPYDEVGFAACFTLTGTAIVMFCFPKL